MQCKIDECGRDAMYAAQQVCQKHYFRFMRTGSYELGPVTNGEPIVTPNGYVRIYAPEHPLASAGRPRVFEHRVVVYDDVGPGEHPCELCGKVVTWATLHIDHIDEDRRNNIRTNLRVTCRGCNTSRTTRGPFYELDGVSKSATQWAAEPGVTVSAHQFKIRLRKGMTVREALFTPNVTHPRAKAKELEQ